YRNNKSCNFSTKKPLLYFGFTLVELLVVIAIIGVLIAILLPAVQMAREAARRAQCSNNIRQLSLAMHLYHDVYELLPTSCTRAESNTSADQQSKGAWSYATQLLPFLEQENLHEQAQSQHIFRDYRGNDGAINNVAPYIGRAKIGYQYCPSDDNSNMIQETWIQGINYGVCDGDYSNRWIYSEPDSSQGTSRGALTYRGYSGFGAITDGLSNTLLFSEHVISSVVGSNLILESIVIDTTAVPGNPGSTPHGNFGTARADLCMNKRGSYGQYNSGNRISAAKVGEYWTSGWSLFTHFNTINPPNAPGCCYGNDVAHPMIEPPTSNHPGGVNAACVDGSGRFINESINCLTTGIAATVARPKMSGASDFGVWGALGTRSGDEPVTPP
ncbi:MAG: DUF1559 domain-containing protein, partial [Planctomycetaceae bacterium]|nr:DUF1559 domain-containing protein [Planctomycetaceae bacterium]